ncbi:MAG: citrate lyase subunit alpha [Caldilineaceae bacterium]
MDAHYSLSGSRGIDSTGRKHAPPLRSCAHYPAGSKLAPSLVAALARAGLRDGMTLSSHHHFRNGDLLMAQVFAAAAELGYAI